MRSVCAVTSTTRDTRTRRRRFGAPAWLAALGLALGQSFAPAVTLAASIEISPAVVEIGDVAGLTIEDSKLQLSLGEAVALALERNLGLAVERYRQSESDLVVRQNFGIYDYTTTVDLSAFDETSPTASNLEAGLGNQIQEQEGQSWNLGLSRLLPSGGEASVNWKNSRFETNSLFATLNPSFRVDFDVSFRQPLLRDLGKLSTERGLRIARTNRDVSRENFEVQVTGTIQQVENAYWNLVEALEQYVVAKESLALAERLHEQNRIRVDVGTLAPLELVQSEAGVATRVEQIIRAEAAIGDSEDRLRQLLNLSGAGIWDLSIVPTTEPEMEPVKIAIENSIRTAIAERPELRSKRRQQENLELEIDYFQNQKLPRLDLAVTYGLNGLGGDVTQRDFLTGTILAQQPGDYGDALDQVAGNDFDGWSVALNLVYPIQNRAGKAQSALAEVAFDRGRAELSELELAVVTDVRRLARFVDTARQQRESARVSRNLEEKNLEAEQKRYENGMSTSFQVLQIQEDLTEARSREVSAVTGYRKALVLYYQATGELIDRSDVAIVGES